MAEIHKFAGPLKQWAWELCTPAEAKVSPSSEAKEGGKEGRNEERKGMEEGKGVMGALFRADHGRPGKALPRSHA